ncbi:MAG: Gfo/Idh/MocA family protein, partial [Planctomycetota bacterium]
MQRLKTAIVGCGKVTDLHAAALANLEESDFRAVCSRSREKAERYGQKYSVRGYSDLKEMIAKEKLDVIIVCTPHPYHAAPAIEAAELGVHVLVEKPLASCLGDCDAMIEAAHK